MLGIGPRVVLVPPLFARGCRFPRFSLFGGFPCGLPFDPPDRSMLRVARRFRLSGQLSYQFIPVHRLVDTDK